MNRNYIKRILAAVITLSLMILQMPCAFAAETVFGQLGDIAYSADKGIYVIGGRNGAIYSSADGENWVKRTSPVTTTIGGNGGKAVAYSEKARAFLIAPTANCLLISDDSVNWSKVAENKFAAAVTAVEELGEYIYVTDLKANIYRAKYDDLENFTNLDQNIKTDSKQWRGICAGGDKVFFYSTAAWDGSAVLAVYESGKFSNVEVVKTSTNDIHRYYDMIYSDALETFILVYGVTGNGYKDSYVAVYNDGKFETVGSVISCAMSIAEADNAYVFGTIANGLLYKIEKSKIMSFSSENVAGIAVPEGFTNTERVYNIAVGADEIVMVGGYNGSVILLNSDAGNAEYISAAYDRAEETGTAIFGVFSQIYRMNGDALTVQLSCAATDQSGVIMSNVVYDVQWSISSVEPEDAAYGISIDESGMLTIDELSDLDDVTFTVTAAFDETEVQKTVTAKKAQVAGSVVISGEKNAVIPMSKDENKYLYTAAVYDTDGAVIDGVEAVWSVSPDDGVSILDGTFTVNTDAVEGEYVITAACDYMGVRVSEDYSITLRQEDVPTDADWNDETALIIPEKGECSYPFTFDIKNQKGEIYAKADSVEPESGEYPAGVSVADGNITLTSEAEPISFNVIAKKGDSFEKTITVKLTKLEVKISGDLKISLSGSNKSVQYEASVTDGEGNAADYIIEWSISDGSCNIDGNGIVYVPSSIKNGTEIVVTASVGGAASDSLTVTISNTQSSSSGSSSGGGSSSGSGSSGVSRAPAVIISSNDELITVPSDEEIEARKDFPFIDMENAAWAKDAVKALYKNGIVSGVTETTFEPNRNVTRAEFVKMLCDLLDIRDTEAAPAFSDCNPTDWYYDYVVSAYNTGIVTGMGSDYFGAKLPLTRQDMAKMLCGVLEARRITLGETAEFADMNKADSYAVNSIGQLIGMGILSGDTDGMFRPKDNTTRAEAAVVINILGGYIR